MRAWYLDSSAIVKFAVIEAESAAIAAWRVGLGDDDVLMTASSRWPRCSERSDESAAMPTSPSLNSTRSISW